MCFISCYPYEDFIKLNISIARVFSSLWQKSYTNQPFYSHFINIHIFFCSKAVAAVTEVMLISYWGTTMNQYRCTVANTNILPKKNPDQIINQVNQDFAIGGWFRWSSTESALRDKCALSPTLLANCLPFKCFSTLLQYPTGECVCPRVCTLVFCLTKWWSWLCFLYVPALIEPHNGV